MLMQWGDYQFNVQAATYDTLVRKHDWRWQAMDVVSAAPVQQFMGVGAETLRISGVVYSSYSGGIGQPDRMRAAAGRGVARAFVDATGVVWGLYACRSVRETQNLIRSDGTPRKQQFDIELVRVNQ